MSNDQPSGSKGRWKLIIACLPVGARGQGVEYYFKYLVNPYNFGQYQLGGNRVDYARILKHRHFQRHISTHLFYRTHPKGCPNGSRSFSSGYNSGCTSPTHLFEMQQFAAMHLPALFFKTERFSPRQLHSKWPGELPSSFSIHIKSEYICT